MGEDLGLECDWVVGVGIVATLGLECVWNAVLALGGWMLDRSCVVLEIEFR